MANDNMAEATLKLQCDDHDSLQEGLAVLLATDGVSEIELIEASGGGDVSVIMTYNPDQISPEQATHILGDYACAPVSEFSTPSES